MINVPDVFFMNVSTFPLSVYRKRTTFKQQENHQVNKTVGGEYVSACTAWQVFWLGMFQYFQFYEWEYFGFLNFCLAISVVYVI